MNGTRNRVISPPAETPSPTPAARPRNPQDGQPQDEQGRYRVSVSARFLLLTFLATCLLSFCVGRATKVALTPAVPGECCSEASSTANQESTSTLSRSLLPRFVPNEGQEMPFSRYLSKNFDSSKSGGHSSWVAETEGGTSKVTKDHETNTSGDGEEEPEQLQLPMAEHLMMDIEHVDAAFLKSEHHLVEAMLQVIHQANLMLLSYHCHMLTPAGVSCVGVLEQNYVSFHTWPEHGVITLDLCVGGSKANLVRVVSTMERAFAVASHDHDDEITTTVKPKVRWAYKVRGFPDKEAKTDFTLFFSGNIGSEFKQQVASVETDFQRIDIFDEAFDPHDFRPYQKGLPTPIEALDSNSIETPPLRPNRLVFLDGCIQSTLFEDAAYHEALVHPAMLAHEYPKRVAIVGGGEGATLREVLKHKTVEEVTMIEIDEQMVEASREHLVEWSDCSDLKKSAPWCVDDPRVNMYYEDAHAWFVDRFPPDKLVPASERFNVIIIDALDPESEIPFAQALYGEVTLLRTLRNALTKNGVLVMQLGESPENHSPDETFSKFKNRVATTKLLEKAGFESVHAYEESHCGFLAPWSFVVALKTYESRQRWYANSAEIDLEIRWRTRKTKSGANPFLYFDGATMASYQEPPRSFETVFCRRYPKPLECIDSRYIFNSHVPSAPITSFEVKTSDAGRRAGRGLFAKEDIPRDAYIAPDVSMDSLRFSPSTYDIVVELFENGPLERLQKEGLTHQKRRNRIRRQYDCLYYYAHAYGFTKRHHGDLEVEVDSSIITFVNHGCRGEYNVGVSTLVDEFSADPNEPVEVFDGKSHTGSSLYNPVIDRHLGIEGDISLEDIAAGEEILDNYLAFVGSEEEWEEDILDLRRMCEGKRIKGSVTEYEEDSRHADVSAAATTDDAGDMKDEL